LSSHTALLLKTKTNSNITNSHMDLFRVKQERLSNRSLYSFFGGVRDMKTFASPRASTCVDICLKLSLLSTPAVPHFICSSALGFHTDDEGPRCSAMRCSSNTPFFPFLFLTLGKLLTEVWLPWDGACGRTHLIRCLTAQVTTDTNLLFLKLFLRGSSITHRGCGFGLRRGLGYICLIKFKKRNCHMSCHLICPLFYLW